MENLDIFLRFYIGYFLSLLFMINVCFKNKIKKKSFIQLYFFNDTSVYYDVR